MLSHRGYVADIGEIQTVQAKAWVAKKVVSKNIANMLLQERLHGRFSYNKQHQVLPPL